MTALEETEKMKDHFGGEWDEKQRLKGRRNRICCNCKMEIEIKNIPGPEDPPPYSCGKRDCDRKRNKLMNRIVG